MASIRLSRPEAEKGELPSLCLRCGAPATEFDSKKFAWHPQWVYVLLLLGLLPMIIVALIITKRMTVRAPFCERHRLHWTWRSRMIGGSFLGLVVLTVFLVYLMGSQTVPQESSGLICGGGFFLALVWAIFAIGLQLASIQAQEITDNHITLDRVEDSFVAALNLQRQQQPTRWTESDLVVKSGGCAGSLLLFVFVGAFVTIVALAAITTVGKNAQKQFPPPPGEFVDTINHFRLIIPAGQWVLLPREEVQKVNKLATAGAQDRNDGVVGMVLVEAATPEFQIDGREQEIAHSMIEQSEVKNKKTESITALDFRGMKAVRYRFSGTSEQTEYRVDSTVFIAHGKIFHLYCWGPVQKTAADGSTFQPFLEAFQLLPTDAARKK